MSGNVTKLRLTVFMSGMLVVLALPQILAASTTSADGFIDPGLFRNLEWRSLGPGIMSGRLTDVEGVPGNPNLVYVAASVGGLWKTTNSGITWTPIFERLGTTSIGDIAVQPGNPEVIWVGTGEDNPRNWVSFGDGVYRSTDGGKSWNNMGLRDSERISRIIIHPSNPNIVYVAAIGHIFGPSEERGVFITTDGGKTWNKSLFLDAEHGAADLEMDPSNPYVLYAAMWRFQRRPWAFQSGSEKGGVFKSIDGGQTWKKITQGLPTLVGRIGIKVAPSNSNVVYALIESREGSFYRSDDRGESFRMVYKDRMIISRGFYFADFRVDPIEENRVYVLGGPMFVSIDGGKTFRRVLSQIHGDFHTAWIDPHSPSRIWVGNDGGLSVSMDRGEKWEYMNTLPLGEVYQLGVDQRAPFYYVCAGMQDNGTWCGPSRSRHYSAIPNDVWQMVSYGDAFTSLIHPKNPDLILTTYHGGGLLRTDLTRAQQQDVVPYSKRNDGGPVGPLRYRFNWNTPIIASSYDSETVYLGSNVVFKSTDFGKSWREISPDLTTKDPEKQVDAGGVIHKENTTGEFHCTIISLGESPVQQGFLWAGTDDGNLQVTKDGGKTWVDLTKNLKGVPSFAQVSHIEASRTGADVAYATFDHHMFDDFRPYVYKTTNLGRSWTNITGDLPPKGYVHVIREDPRNPNILYVGTELGVFVSFVGGNHWLNLGLNNLPTIAVNDIIVHSRDNDLILGTHGRGIWIFDDLTPLQQLTQKITQQDNFLFATRPGLLHSRMRLRPHLGDKAWRGPNPAYGALITYYLREKLDQKTDLKIEILDQSGKILRSLTELPREKGLNRVAWDLRYEPPPERPKEHESFPGFRFWWSYFSWANQFSGEPSAEVMPGEYVVKLLISGKAQTATLRVELDPTLEISLDAVRSRHDVSRRLQEMAKDVTLATRTLWSVEDQITLLQKTVQKVSGKGSTEITRNFEEILTSGTKLQRELTIDSWIRKEGPAITFAEGPKLLEHINDLLRRIQLVYAEPTPYQMEYFVEVEGSYKSLMERVQNFITRSVPQLNETLRKEGVASVIVVVVGN